MNLFIDTNIYLTFYHFSKDDLEELKKLEAAIKNGQIKLFVTEQVINEYKRNREIKISEALKKLNEQKLPNQFPQFCKEYDEYSVLTTSIKTYDANKNKLIAKLTEDIKKKTLGADTTISRLFAKAVIIPTTPELLETAKRRYDIGNPPGKNSSYGDAINWEGLLRQVKKEEDLHFVTQDQDYVSRIDNLLLSDFLSDEWKHQKKSNIFLYTYLSDFFRSHFPDIKLASELERQYLISNFINSSSFAITHAIIRKLKNCSDFSKQEVNSLIEASYTNNQIFGIIDDPDVKNFISHLFTKYSEDVDSEISQKFSDSYNEVYADNSIEICTYCNSGLVRGGEPCPECSEVYIKP